MTDAVFLQGLRSMWRVLAPNLQPWWVTHSSLLHRLALLNRFLLHRCLLHRFLFGSIRYDSVCALLFEDFAVTDCMQKSSAAAAAAILSFDCVRLGFMLLCISDNRGIEKMPVCMLIVWFDCFERMVFIVASSAQSAQEICRPSNRKTVWTLHTGQISRIQPKATRGSGSWSSKWALRYDVW